MLCIVVVVSGGGGCDGRAIDLFHSSGQFQRRIDQESQIHRENK